MEARVLYELGPRPRWIPSTYGGDANARNKPPGERCAAGEPGSGPVGWLILSDVLASRGKSEAV